MRTQYVLIARGNLALVELQIHVPGRTVANAVELAKLMVAALDRAGYRSFELFDTSSDDQENRVARLRVESLEPVIVVSP